MRKGIKDYIYKIMPFMEGISVPSTYSSCRKHTLRKVTDREFVVEDVIYYKTGVRIFGGVDKVKW